MTYLVALACVLDIAVGQILFKTTASHANGRDGLGATALMPLATTLVAYGITTLAWLWVLQRTEQVRIYALMALAFVIVPIGSAGSFRSSFGRPTSSVSPSSSWAS